MGRLVARNLLLTFSFFTNFFHFFRLQRLTSFACLKGFLTLDISGGV